MSEQRIPATKAAPPRKPLIEYAKPANYKEPSTAQAAPSAAEAAPSTVSDPSQPSTSPAPPVPRPSSQQVAQQQQQQQSQPAGPPRLPRKGSDMYPVADADAGETSVSSNQSLSLVSEAPIDEEDEYEDESALEEQRDEAATHKRDTEEPRSDLQSPLSRKNSSKEPSQLMKDLEAGGEKVMSVLRGSHDEGPLVDDVLLETMDFDKDEDYVNEDFMERKSAVHRHFTLFLQFLLTVSIAFVTAMLMFIVSHSVEELFSFKVESALKLIEDSNPAGGYFALLSLSLLFVGTSAALVAIVAPHSRGGGVPYVLAYLNGTNVKDYFSWRIVLIKTGSLIFTIAGGLTLGMEGPFVFIGGGVAAILISALDKIFPFFPKHSTIAKIIRSIREERIFMAGGMAAGLAVAFDAPIAGVLFALEGATAFLSAPVLLRIFGCAMFASFFNDLGHTNFSKYIKNHNLLEVSNSGTPSAYAWTLLEVFPFIVIAVIGGVVGAVATKINMKMSKWRHHAMQGETWKDVGKQVLEICIFALITITCWFVLPYIYGCRPKHELCDVVVSALPIRCQQAHCGEGQYSEAASIVYSTSNQIAALMFDRSLGWAQEFHTAPLITYGVIYWLLVSTIYGAYVPGGLFVPSIVVGGMYGRVVGIACKAMFPDSSINPGVYSLLGAASMLGGFTRLALPVVIMLVELTGDATYLLPMMFCSVVGKFISDYMEPPLYPQHMALEKIPSLTDKLNPEIAKKTAHEIMIPAHKCYTVCTIEKLSVVKAILAQSKRVVFPVIAPTGSFAGLILRRNVMHCVKHAPTYRTREEAQEALQRHDHAETIRTLKADWHNDHRDEAATITYGVKEVEEAFINFAPYMDAGCMTARPQTPAKRLAALFRRVGLSHLCITDKDNLFQGLITRRSLITVQQAADEHSHSHPPTEHSTPSAASHSSSSSTLVNRKLLQGSKVQAIAEEVEEQRTGGGFNFAEELAGEEDDK